MLVPTKKLKNGFEITSLGFGTWKMGGMYNHDPKNDDARDIGAIRHAINSGITTIDTAELYAGGYAETLVGQAIHGYDRNSLFISTKVIGRNASSSAIKNACKNSLKRLGTPYIDLYYIHWRDKQFDLSEQMSAMNELVDEGLIRHIGVCNFSVESLKEAQSYSKYPIVANQVHYNLIFREPQKTGLLEYCQQHDVMLVAWRPLQYGELTHTNYLAPLREKYQKTDAQIAIQWLISQPNVVTLFKSSSLEHIDENLGGLGWDMNQKDLSDIRDYYPQQAFVSDTVTLG